MSDTVRIGVVGTSWWTDWMFGPSLRSHPQAEWVAICGRTRSRTEEMAAKFSVPQVYTDYREMLAQAGLQAVVIATPDDEHYAMTMAAVGAGLHVLCEKPLALHAAQALEMAQAADAARVQHMVLFTWRWMPHFQYFHDLVAQGAIGRLYHGEFNFMFGYARQPDYAWRWDQDRANGVLGDLGSHLIDMARWLVGDITQVQAQLDVCVPHPGADGGQLNPANDAALLLVKFANGGQGVIQASGVAHTADRAWQQVRLYGEAGSLEIDVTNDGATLWAAGGADKAFRQLTVPDAYWGDVSRTDTFQVFSKQSVGARLFIDAILAHQPVTPNFYDGYQAQRVVDAALEAHRTGGAVRVE
jgi:predicted dehydrogenase